MNDRPWWGAVLTGGASSRMGRDKAALEIGGVPMAQRVAGALRAAGAVAVAAVGSPVPDCTHLQETPSGEGPLGAVLAALAWAGGPLVVAPCDLLAPDAATFAELARSAAAGPPVDVCVPVLDGHRQVLTAWFAPEAASALAAQFSTGERSMRRALTAGGLTVREVPGLAAAALRDADTPRDVPGADG